METSNTVVHLFLPPTAWHVNGNKPGQSPSQSGLLVCVDSFEYLIPESFIEGQGIWTGDHTQYSSSPHILIVDVCTFMPFLCVVQPTMSKDSLRQKGDLRGRFTGKPPIIYCSRSGTTITCAPY